VENIVGGRDKGREKGEKEEDPSQSKGEGAGHFDPIENSKLFVHTFGLGKLGRVVGVSRTGPGRSRLVMHLAWHSTRPAVTVTVS
jgi:hypothetical protein